MLLLMLVVSSLYVISIFLFQGRGCQFLSVFTALTFGMAPFLSYLFNRMIIFLITCCHLAWDNSRAFFKHGDWRA